VDKINNFSTPPSKYFVYALALVLVYMLLVYGPLSPYPA